MSKLAAAKGMPPASGFAAALSGARVFIDVQFPGESGIRTKMRLLSRLENQTVDIETRAYLEAKSYALTVGSSLEYNAELATRSLAIACREFDDVSVPLASVDEWRANVDDQLIGYLWERYGDLRDQLDPIEAGLTEAEAAEIIDAIKKKDATLLRSYGLANLVRCLVTTDAHLVTSPTPKSGYGEGSPQEQAPTEK